MKSTSIFVYTPAHLLPARLPFLLNRKLQPEVACQEVVLDNLDFDLLGASADQLYEQGLRTTMHAPFGNFNPGSRKNKIRKGSMIIAEKSMQLATKLRAKRIVFHPGLAHGCEEKELDLWLQNSLNFWPDFLAQAAEIDCTICIENIYESSPDIFIKLLKAIDSPHMRHVFDIGHWNLFSNLTLLDWLNATAPYLQHMHLHDNLGERDEHLAIGAGNIPFATLFEWLQTAASKPTLTLENHQLPDAEVSLQQLQQYLPLT